MSSSEVTGPQYISSHSADVILSDIRPIKLKLEGLRSINVLLDEFLFNILNTARSLSTDKLRASLLNILPTSLGKEALLEAEVELRAYWDRTPRPSSLDDDAGTFNLQWAFELLRLKCEAYCTLNESDEDSAAVAKLQERMAALGGTTPPPPALVAPASLYLTAILESMCEHILSNVGRVAARDSSRTGATVQDVFVALCEDHAIYALFKSMRVYQQIELLTQTPKPRRSKSFSRNERTSLSRHSPSNQEPSSGRESSAGHRSRASTDMSSQTPAATTAAISPSTSRSSFEKARKKFTRSSNEDGLNGAHKRSESGISEDSKQMLAAYNQREDAPEDSALEKEFDNLMRSGSTMKVSLTPDRLKTMEVYKQEKDRNRRPAPLSIGKTDDSSSAPKTGGRRPSARTVDSIVEDEEEAAPKSGPTPRRKNSNITSPPNLPSSSTTSTTSSTASRGPPARSFSRSNLQSQAPDTSMAHRRPVPSQGGGGPRGFDADPGFPVKTRRIQKNRESLDLDDVMAGSDDEEDIAPVQQHPPRTPSKAPTTLRSPSSAAVSKSTRELMDFLNEGPPEMQKPKMSSAGRDMVDFLNQGPPDYMMGTTSSNGISTMDNGNGKKGSGRLQRMMSKLSMNSERTRSQPSEDFGRGKPPPTTPIRSAGPGLGHQTSYGNLGNRPVPPRPPPVQPISPPSSPSDEDYGSARARKLSSAQPSTPKRTTMPTWEQQMADGQSPLPMKPADRSENGINGVGYPRNGANGYARNGVVNITGAMEEGRPRRPSAAAETKRVQQPQPKPVQTSSPTSPAVRHPAPIAPVVAEDQARDMRRMLSTATNVDECRLIFEMFLAKSGVKLEPASCEVPYPSPVLSDSQHAPTIARGVPATDDGAMELALVELLLGGGASEGSLPVQLQVVAPQPSPRKPLRSKKRSEPRADGSATPTSVNEMAYESLSVRKYTVNPDASLRTHTQNVPVAEVGA
ncbi:hypothetical protein MKEN_00139400 [Mycena kentingensis (nom. inval.)]|nr:hypothetical protein MKEN_00139400 [Mycena kentingensis (nom. inval.)]